MRKTIASLVVMGLFSAMLVGTSKPKDGLSDSEAGTATPTATSAAPTGAPTSPQAVIPSAATWPETKIAKAKVAIQLPKGASAPAANAGADYLSVTMPSGYSVFVRPKDGVVATTKEFYRKNAAGEIHTIYDAPDAIVANRKESGPAGSYCEVTACSAPIRGKAFCVESAGADVDGTKVKKLTAEECVDVVAMVRTIKAIP